MQPSLLDTDIFSEILKGKDSNVARNSSAYRLQFGVYTLAAPTVTEIVKGFHKLGREDQIQTVLQGLKNEQVLSVDLETAVIAGRIYAELEKTGQPIGRLDPFIAAIALHHDLVLVTGNAKHFERVAAVGFNLKLDNWRLPLAQ